MSQTGGSKDLLMLALGTALRTSRAPLDKRFESHAKQLCASPIVASLSAGSGAELSWTMLIQTSRNRMAEEVVLLIVDKKCMKSWQNAD